MSATPVRSKRSVRVLSGARLAGDSSEQREAERQMIAAFAKEVGCRLSRQQVTHKHGFLELDGCNRDRSVLCEASAHLGTVKSAQKMKVMTDAAKLVLAARIVGRRPRKVMLFADERAAAWFQRGSWMAEALRTMRVEVKVVNLPNAVKEAVRAAQKRQFR